MHSSEVALQPWSTMSGSLGRNRIMKRSRQMQESMALLKMLALGNRQIDAGRVQPAAEVIARLRERHRAD